MKHMTITRQSIFILITRLIALEVMVSVLGYLIKIPLINGWADSLSLYTGITLIVQALNILFIILVVLRWVTTEYRIENNSLIMKHGIISTKEKSYSLDSVETVEVEQSLAGRLFKFGTVHIFSPLFPKHVYVWAIPEPNRFADEIKSHIPNDSKVTVAARK